MKVWLELAVKNAQKIKEDVEGQLKGIDLEGILGTIKGAKKATAGVSGIGDIAGIVGNLGKIAGTGVAALGALILIKKTLDRMWDSIKRSSPYLQGILSVMTRAWMLFWRPFGDFLGALLKPLAIALLKMAVSWLKFTRGLGGPISEKLGFGGGGDKVIDIQPTEMKPGDKLVDRIKTWWDNLIDKLKTIDFQEIHEQGVANLRKWSDFFKDIHTKGVENINEWLDFFKDKLEKAKDKIKEFGSWLWGKLKTAWNYTEDFGDWLWEKLQTIWNYTEDFGDWLWGKLKTVWDYTEDFGNWLWHQLKQIWKWTYNVALWLFNKMTSGAGKIWEWTFNLGEWLYNKITNSVDNITNWLAGIGSFLYKKITENIENALSGFLVKWRFDWWDSSYQTGTNAVPRDGLFRLHKGEKVITAPRADNGSSQSIVLSPTFNINNNRGVNDLDLDSQVRRAARMLEFEVRQRFLV